MRTAILHVEGMSCSGCAKNVEGAVSELAGVQSVKVRLADKQAEVVYNEEKLSLDTVKDAIKERGFSVE
jgi:copper chaperone